MNADPILALIREFESDGAVKAQGVASSYDVVSAYIPKAHRPKHALTSYPVGEILEWQAFVVRKGSKSSAAGAYQIIRPTLADLFSAHGPVIFDAKAQDAAAKALLVARGWQRFEQGDLSAIAYADRLAREWASLPVQWDQQGAHRRVKRGQSYYAGDGINAAHCPPERVVRALEACREETGILERIAALEARVTEIEEKLEK